MKRLVSLYPLLLAIVPLLSLAANNGGEYTVPDLLTLLAGLLIGFGLLQAALSWSLRRRAAPGVVPIITLTAVAWFYGYVPLFQVLLPRLGVNPEVSSTFAPLLVGAGTVAGIWWLVRARPNAEGLNRFFALMGLLLVGWTGIQIAISQVRAPRALARSTVAKEFARPVAVNSAEVGRNTPKPDIYLIVMDELANASVLSERFGFDNSAFEDSLQSLGFTIPASVRSNYDETLFSLPSLLNFGHVTGLEADLGPDATDRSLPFYLLEHNRLVRFLKDQGYQFVLVPAGWRGTSRSPYADAVLVPPEEFNVGRLLRSTGLRLALASTTLLGVLFQPGPVDAEYILNTFDLLGRVPERAETTFTLAHFMMPHQPYRFDAACRPLANPIDGSDRGSPEAKAAYVAQVRCLHRLVLTLVRSLIERSPTPPLILLQGDHGSRTLAPVADRTDPRYAARARERFGAFGAYYMPAGGDSLFTGSITLVNVFPRLLNYYFGTDIPSQPDRSYLTPDKTFYHFIAVHDTTLTLR